MKRILTTLVLVPFALYSVFLAPQWLFVAIVIMMAGLCYHEFAGIAHASGAQGPLWTGFLAGAAVVLWPETLPLWTLLALSLAMLAKDLPKSLLSGASLVLALVYVWLGWHWAIPLRAASPYWILYALAINWVGDVAAFYVGRKFGRHKLAPRISPAKSWEGSIASIVAAVIFGIWYGPQFGLLDWRMMAVLSVIANIAGQIGDLCESALKRGAGVKDSGTFLPGHGGFLDRLDSTLFTLPVVWFFLRIVTAR